VADGLPHAVAVDYGGVIGPDWYEGVGARVAAEMGDAPWVAVLHSGAGGFAPAIAEAAPELAGFVFIDAVMPYPGRSCLENAPAALVERLRRVVSDGRLAPWNEWFDQDPAARLIPDAAQRAEFLAELPRVPFAFLEAVCRDGDEWECLPAAYVQLSAGYDREAAQAEARGWRVQRAHLNHLAMLGEAAKVAQLLSEASKSLA
jgi:hypothetical protein